MTLRTALLLFKEARPGGTAHALVSSSSIGSLCGG